MVVKLGPISLDDIFPVLGYSRSATFRALKALTKSGWVRQTINKHQYIATALVDEYLVNGNISLPEMDHLSYILAEIYENRACFAVQVGFYINHLSFELFECTEQKKAPHQELFPDEENIACVAYCLLSAKHQAQILTRTSERIDLIAQEHLQEQIVRYRSTLERCGYICDFELQKIYFALRSPLGHVGALCLTKKQLSTNQLDLETEAQTMRGLLGAFNLLPYDIYHPRAECPLGESVTGAQPLPYGKS